MVRLRDRPENPSKLKLKVRGRKGVHRRSIAASVRRGFGICRRNEIRASRGGLGTASFQPHAGHDRVFEARKNNVGREKSSAYFVDRVYVTHCESSRFSFLIKVKVDVKKAKASL